GVLLHLGDGTARGRRLGAAQHRTDEERPRAGTALRDVPVDRGVRATDLVPVGERAVVDLADLVDAQRGRSGAAVVVRHADGVQPVGVVLEGARVAGTTAGRRPRDVDATRRGVVTGER